MAVLTGESAFANDSADKIRYRPPVCGFDEAHLEGRQDYEGRMEKAIRPLPFIKENKKHFVLDTIALLDEDY